MPVRLLRQLVLLLRFLRLRHPIRVGCQFAWPTQAGCELRRWHKCKTWEGCGIHRHRCGCGRTARDATGLASDAPMVALKTLGNALAGFGAPPP